MPKIPNLELAAYYRTSRWAGGDYYDFFPLPDGRWGILVADVSGHGTPAAVMMAITHSLAHSLPGPADPPATLLGHVNRQLSMHYTIANEVFVTAFYGIYDPVARTLTYSSAGHNPPRLMRCHDGTVQAPRGSRRAAAGPGRRLSSTNRRRASYSPATSWRFTPTESPRPWMHGATSSARSGSMRF